MANLAPGARGHEPALTLTHTSDGTGSPGDALTWDSAASKVTVATQGDDVYGVMRDRHDYGPESDTQYNPSDGEDVSVGVWGTFNANVASGAELGDDLGVGSTNGQFSADPAGDGGATTPDTHIVLTENSAGDPLVFLR